MSKKVVLLIGTADTKADELLFLKTCVEGRGRQGGHHGRRCARNTRVPSRTTRSTPWPRPPGRRTKRSLPWAGENEAMIEQAKGAAALTRKLAESGAIDGMLAIGGTMGTDLALDVAQALPLGFPKLIASTVAYSSLIAPDRISADVMMILWSGGLYGLNPICRSILSQAAHAVVGACRFRTEIESKRPLVGLTSLGTSALTYVVTLKPELERRGYDVVVFHTTGLGGRAMESMLSKGALAAVMDFSLPEVSNHEMGSVVTAGSDRLENAGRHGVPQIVAPGAVTLVDMQSWSTPDKLKDRDVYAHNRLISCASLTKDEKVHAARTIATKLNQATGPTAFIVPRQGLDAWDGEGGPFHDPEGLTAFTQELEDKVGPSVELHPLDHHINDDAFAAKAPRDLRPVVRGRPHPTRNAMSLYYLQKFLYELNRDEAVQERCRADIDSVIAQFDLTDEEAGALREGDIGLLYVLGVNGQILMHYAAFLGIEWFDYLDRMRAGIEKHGPVRAGVYAMTGGGKSFTEEEKKR